MSGRQQCVYRIERRQFPEDFPERLERLRQACDLSWRGLARALRLHPRSLRRWRRGAKPDAAHLLALIGFAAERGLLDCLMPQAPPAGAGRGGEGLGGDAAEFSSDDAGRIGPLGAPVTHEAD